MKMSLISKQRRIATFLSVECPWSFRYNASSHHACRDLRAQAEPSRKATVSLANNNPRHTETQLVLDRAQRDLSELCIDVDGSPESWKALSYFVSKRQQYERLCDLEHEEGHREAHACASLNALEKFAREQMVAGSVENLRNQLLIMQRMEERRAAAAAAAAAAGQSEQQPEAATSVPPLSAEQIHERACLIRLFHHLDTDGDGEINMLEFQDGMEALGAVLTEHDIRQISDAVAEAYDSRDPLDGCSHRMDLDGFIDVLDASPVLRGVAVGSGNANFFRHAAHVRGHLNQPTIEVACS